MIDTHCHLIDPQFKKDLDAVLARAQQNGITIIVNAGYDVKTSSDAVAMSKKISWLKPAIGIHPNEAAQELIKEVTNIEKILKQGKIIAIGETGLDYYRNYSPRQAQQELFRRHIDIAKRNNLPLLIHTRHSIEDTVKILKEEKYHCGVFHCYSGNYEQAKTIIDMGFYLGFGGVLTFSKQTQEVFRKQPTDRILLETDAPFLSPAGHRGKRNEPAFMIETLNTAAHLLDVDSDYLEKILDQNASHLFSF